MFLYLLLLTLSASQDRLKDFQHSSDKILLFHDPNCKKKIKFSLVLKCKVKFQCEGFELEISFHNNLMEISFQYCILYLSVATIEREVAYGYIKSE